jgi:hypothetical protein
MNIQLVIDRTPAKELEHEVLSLAHENSLLDRDGKVSFVGVVCKDNRIFTFVPRNTETRGLSEIWVTNLVLNVLNRYNSEAATTITDGDLDPENANSLAFLSSILWLLQDFAEHGLYTTNSTNKTVNRGRINWTRTIAKETPLFSGDTPVYLNLHSERIQYGIENPVTKIHAEIVKALDVGFGWLITGDTGRRLAPELDVVSEDNLVVEDSIFRLEKELSRLYRDRDIELVKCLLHYLRGQLSGAAGIFVLGVRLFHSVWERILDSTLPTTMNVNQLLPRPAYYKSSSDRPIMARGMRTDTVLVSGNKAAVVDAKYYGAMTLGAVPGWADIVKQIYYVEGLKKIKPNTIISSWFAFPGKFDTIVSGPIQKVDIVDPGSGTVVGDPFTPTFCAYFCPLESMQNYVDQSKYSLEEVASLLR